MGRHAGVRAFRKNVHDDANVWRCIEMRCARGIYAFAGTTSERAVTSL